MTSRFSSRVTSSIVVALAGLAFVWPALSQLFTFDRRNSAAVDAQRVYDQLLGRQIDHLIAIVRRDGGGRVYAGMPSNWGQTFRIGDVPVFKYLESRDVDEVGYTLRTASLMTDPEFYFDERNPSDYRLFGIRYLILPPAHRPPIPAHLITCVGSYCLWDLPRDGYVQAGRIGGQLTADRTNVGVRSLTLLQSPLAEKQAYLRLSLGKTSRSLGQPLVSQPLPSAPVVVSQDASLARGFATALVRMPQAGVVVLSASVDPGWTARVDGRPAKVFPVAPALVATSVPAGIHRVTFEFAGFSGYWVLFLLGGLSVAVLAVIDRKGTRGRRRWHARTQLTPEVNQDLHAHEQLVAAAGETGVVLDRPSDERVGDSLVGIGNGRD